MQYMQYTQYYSPMLGCFSSRQIRASRSNFWWSDNTNTEITDQSHWSGICLLINPGYWSGESGIRIFSLIAGVSQTTGNQSNQSSWSINVTVIVSLSLIFIQDKLRRSETGGSGFSEAAWDLIWASVWQRCRDLCVHIQTPPRSCSHSSADKERARFQRDLCISVCLVMIDQDGFKSKFYFPFYFTA